MTFLDPKDVEGAIEGFGLIIARQIEAKQASKALHRLHGHILEYRKAGTYTDSWVCTINGCDYTSEQELPCS